jgi:predicted PurR-regulated permease PerM
VGGGLGALLLYISLPVLPILAMAAIVAFLLKPMIDLLHRRLRLRRSLATAVVYVMLLIFVLAAFLLMLPAVIDAAESIRVDLADLVPEMIRLLRVGLEERSTFRILNFTIDLSSILSVLPEDVLEAAQTQVLSLEDILGTAPDVATAVTGIASGVLGVLSVGAFALILGVITSIYLALDVHRMEEWARRQIPDGYLPEYDRLMEDIGDIWSSYFRGQLILCGAVGAVTWLGNMAIGLPGALLLGIIAGALTIIPNLGPLLAIIPAVFIALVQGSTILPVNNLVFAGIVTALYVLIQMFQGNLILPRVIGEAVDLPPVAVLLGVVVGFGVAGIIGAFLAVPLMASLRVLVSYAYDKLRDIDPFPREMTPSSSKDERTTEGETASDEEEVIAGAG